MLNVKMKLIDFSRVRTAEDLKDILNWYFNGVTVWDDDSERFDGIRRFLVDRPKW